MTHETLKDAISKAFDYGYFDAREMTLGRDYKGKQRNHELTGAELVWMILEGAGKVKHRRILKAAYEAGKMAYNDSAD